MHPLRGLYLDFSLKCEQLSRPAHVIRRLMECWFELAIESCHFMLPPPPSTSTTNQENNNNSENKQKVGVDIFGDPKYFITGDMLERACFGYSETLTLQQDSSSGNSNKSNSTNLYSFGRTAPQSSATISNLDSSTSSSSNSATSNFHVYYSNSLISTTPLVVSCSQANAGPLRPLTSFALNGPSSSMPRECASLLACLISGILQQRRGAVNAQVRTLQDHFTMFQELRGTTTTSSSNNNNQNNSNSTSNVDSIDSWLKAAALLRRWGIIRAFSSVGGTQNSSNNSNNFSNQTGNVAVSITATSKLDLEIENIDVLTKLVQNSISVVFDNATAQNIKALLR